MSLEILTKRKEAIDAQAKRVMDDLRRVNTSELVPLRKTEHANPDRDFNFDPDSQDMLLMEKAESPFQKELHKFNDTLSIIQGVLRCDPRETRYFKSRMCRESHLRKNLAKALDTATATDGSEWVPRGNMSATFIEFYSLAAKIPMVFDPVQMPTATFDMPYDDSLSTISLIAENTADEGSATRVTDGSPTTGKLTLSAKTLGCRIPFSYELDEDAVVAVAPRLRKKLAMDMGKGAESAVIEGDTAVTHMHTDITGSTDRRKAFRGLRFQAYTNSHTISLSTFNVTTVRSVRAYTGKYGVDPSEGLWVMGPITYLKHFVNLADVVTRDKYGDNAFVLSGEIAKFDGVPVIVSDQMREDLATTGIYSATGNSKGSLMYVHRPSFVWGNRTGMEMELWANPLYRQRHLIAAQRNAFNTHLTTAKIVALGINVDAS